MSKSLSEKRSFSLIFFKILKAIWLLRQALKNHVVKMVEKEPEIIIRINLSFDGLLQNIIEEFDKIEDNRKNPRYQLRDILLAGFAMFSLKDPSLLAFEKRLTKDKNLQSIYKLKEVPSDSQVRTVLDETESGKLSKPHRFRHIVI